MFLCCTCFWWCAWCTKHWSCQVCQVFFSFLFWFVSFWVPFPFSAFSLPSWVSPLPPSSPLVPVLGPFPSSVLFFLFSSLSFPFSSLGCFFFPSFLLLFLFPLSFPFLPFLPFLSLPLFFLVSLVPFLLLPSCLLSFPPLVVLPPFPLLGVLLVSSVCPFSRVCSFGSIKLALPSSLGREAMDRSRSPHRSAAPVAGTRPLVNFPVWSGPNTSDNNPRGTSLPPSQTPTLQWTQGSRGLQPSQGLPMTQDSQQIPPGQVGQSQPLMGLSQQSYHTPQAQGWGPGYGSPVAPRPQVHGIGLGGMVPTFPPTPPTWTSSQFPGHVHGHFRPPHYGQGTPPSQRPTQTTPSSRSNSGTPYTPGKQPLGRIPNIPLGQHWKPDEEHYDSQKLNGLTLPRTIRSSSWTQLKDIEGCDPLTVPLSKLLYQGSENFWLRKLAAGREVYVATMGEVSQVVFVSEILSQLRSRGIDLDKLAQHKALQDGHALEKREAIQSLAKQIGDQLQCWAPTTQADTSSQHKIAELEARLAALQAAANQPPAAASQQAQVPAPAPEAPSPSPRVQSPIEAAFQGQRPTVFDPAQLLVSPGSNNQWLENNMIDSLSDSKYKSWFKNLKLDNATRQTIERNIVAVDNWWQNQPEEAEATIHRVAVCSGIPPAKIKSGQNENLLKVLTVALTMTAWLCTVLKRTSCMAQVAPALRLCKHQITILATLTPLTLSSSINIFFAFRILQTRLMILYSLHCPNFNSKLGALLRGATCLRHLYGTTITAHQQFSRSFFEPCTVYLRFCHVPRLQPLFYIGSTAENTLEREHTRFRKFKQVNEGHFVLSELAIRYWSHCNNFFLWSPVPIYIRRERHWALEHALIQLWQPKLNFPFISQMFIPRKGIIHRQPFSNSRQFGIRTLWRKKRWKHTARTSKNCWTPPCFWTESESGPFFKTWDPIPGSAMNKLNLFVASILAFRDAMHFDVWHNICQRPTYDWHYKQWMVLLNFAVANLLVKSDLSNAHGCSPTGWSAMYDKFSLHGIMVSKALLWLSMNLLLRWCFPNTLHWWTPFAITKMLFKIGRMIFLLLVNVIFWNNFLQPEQPPMWEVNTGYWMVLSLDLYYLEPLDKWLEVLWTTRFSPTRKRWRSSLWMPSNYGANRTPSLVHQKGGSYNNLNLFGLTMSARFPITSLLLPFVNSKNNFQNVFSTMKTNVPHHSEFFVHANISKVSTKLSVTLLFLPAPWKLQKFAYKWLCNTYAISLTKLTPGLWARAKASLRAISYQKGRNTMLRDVLLLDSSLHPSSRCWVP